MVNLIKDQSGMDFIADNTFHIENSSIYVNIGKGIKSVEFIRAKEDKLLFVEAKTTFPNPDNPSAENYKRFQEEINNICDKFIHSLNIYASIKIGVNDEVFAADFAPPETISIVFILVIKNHKTSWCRKITPKIISMLPPYFKKIWKPEVYVFNHETAIKQNLTIA